MKKLLFDVVGVVCMLGSIFGGIAIYIWTIVLGFKAAGFLGAIACFFLPFISQIYFIIVTTIDSSFLNGYNITILCYIVILIVGFIYNLVTGEKK